MNAPTAAAAPAPRNPWLAEIRYEFLRQLRSPGFALPTLLFPPMFYLLFAVLMPMGRSGGWQAAHYLLATYTVFGVMAPGLFGFGATVAVEREQGWLRLKRAAPMPAGAWLLAKAAMAVAFALLIFSIMAALAAGVAGVCLPAPSWLALAAVAALGVLPFCAAGLWIGLVASAQAAPAIVNLVYLPMAFLGGLWFPLMLLPAAVQAAAPLWPAYHLGQLALAAVGQGSAQAPALHALALLAFGLLFGWLARRALLRA